MENNNNNSKNNNKGNIFKTAKSTISNFISEKMIKNSIFDGQKWKRNFNNNVVKPVQWVIKNPQKAQQALTTVAQIAGAINGQSVKLK